MADRSGYGETCQLGDEGSRNKQQETGSGDVKQEGFEFAEDGIFEVFLEVAVLESEEVENVGITENEVGL